MPERSLDNLEQILVHGVQIWKDQRNEFLVREPPWNRRKIAEVWEEVNRAAIELSGRSHHLFDKDEIARQSTLIQGGCPAARRYSMLDLRIWGLRPYTLLDAGGNLLAAVDSDPAISMKNWHDHPIPESPRKKLRDIARKISEGIPGLELFEYDPEAQGWGNARYYHYWFTLRFKPEIYAQPVKKEFSWSRLLTANVESIEDISRLWSQYRENLSPHNLPWYRLTTNSYLWQRHGANPVVKSTWAQFLRGLFRDPAVREEFLDSLLGPRCLFPKLDELVQEEGPG